MALDARRRSSLYGKLIPILGEDDANALMSEFPANEADELVTKEFHRAETAVLRSEFQSSVAELRSEFEQRLTAVDAQLADLRVEMAERFRQQTVLFGGAFAAMTAVLGTLISLD